MKARRWCIRFVCALLVPLFVSCGGPSVGPPTTLERLRTDHTGKLREQLFNERQKERDDLARQLASGSEADAVHDRSVLEAIRRVPRHAFLDPAHLMERAYMDRALPIGYGQTISKPSDISLMMELLKLGQNDKVLEIGTGSGYQSALLSQITPHVFSIEIVKPLAKAARERLMLLGYDKIQLRVGDGYFGWPEQAPFQAIIVTCAAGHIPPPLLDQLAAGGRMVIPVGDPYGAQRLILVSKDESGKAQTEDHMTVRFVPMTGAAGKVP